MRSASRCVPVRNRVMKNCPDADNEQWDIFEDNGFSRLGDVMYKSAFDALQMDMLVADIQPKKRAKVVPPAPEANKIMMDIEKDDDDDDDDVVMATTDGKDEEEETQEVFSNNDNNNSTNSKSKFLASPSSGTTIEDDVTDSEL